MVNSHSQSFFGQNIGLIVFSSSREDPFIYFRCLKRKPDGIWEKPTSGEGKVIKCTMDEIVMILEVLNRKLLNWQSFHTYNDIKTPISFSWEDEKAKILWINIANYSKMLKFAQAEILRRLISHILKEKIKYATSSNKQFDNIENREKNASLKRDFKKNNTIDNSLISPLVNSEKNILKEVSNIDGIIKKETEKALLINFNDGKDGKEIWIPKSTIRCQYLPKKNLTQKFLIDNWILNRNKIIS